MPFESYPPPPFPPVDGELVDRIVSKLKSQGIFDQFRKDCLADVDIVPAYQNLEKRVNTTVGEFLAQHTWQQDLNKIQLRESLRRHLQLQEFLDLIGNRIVDQAVGPKINSVFRPKVADVVYECLGIEKPKTEPPPTIKSWYFSAPPPPPKLADLLPEDLDPVSPESADMSMSPGTPTLDERNHNDDSQLSGISELSSHVGDSFTEHHVDSNTIKSISSPKGNLPGLQFDNFTNLSEKIKQAERSHGQVTDPHTDLKADLSDSSPFEAIPMDISTSSPKESKHNSSLSQDVKLELLSNNSMSTYDETTKTFNKFFKDETCTTFSEGSMASSSFSIKDKVTMNSTIKSCLESENSITPPEPEEKLHVFKEESTSSPKTEVMLKLDVKIADEKKDSKHTDEKDKKERDSSSSKYSKGSEKHRISESKYRSSSDRRDDKSRKEDSKSSKGSEKERLPKDEQSRSKHKDEKNNSSSKDKSRDKDKSSDRKKEHETSSKVESKSESKEYSDKDGKSEKDRNGKESSSRDKDKDKNSRSKNDRDKERHERDKKDKERSDKDRRDRDRNEKDSNNKDKLKNEKDKNDKERNKNDSREKEKESRYGKDKTKYIDDKKGDKERDKVKDSDDKRKEQRRHEKSSHASSSKRDDKNEDKKSRSNGSSRQENKTDDDKHEDRKSRSNVSSRQESKTEEDKHEDRKCRSIGSSRQESKTEDDKHEDKKSRSTGSSRQESKTEDDRLEDKKSRSIGTSRQESKTEDDKHEDKKSRSTGSSKQEGKTEEDRHEDRKYRSSGSSKQESKSEEDKRDRKSTSSGSRRAEEEKKERKRKGERCNDGVKSKEARRSSDRDSNGGKGGTSHHRSNASESRHSASQESTHTEKRYKGSNSSGNIEGCEAKIQPSQEKQGLSEIEQIMSRLHSSIAECEASERNVEHDEVPAKKPKIAMSIFEVKKVMLARKNIDKKNKLEARRKEKEDLVIINESEEHTSSSIEENQIPEENKENIKTHKIDKLKVARNGSVIGKFFGFQQSEMEISEMQFLSFCKKTNISLNDLGESSAEGSTSFVHRNDLSASENGRIVDDNLNNLKGGLEPVRLLAEAVSPDEVSHKADRSKQKTESRGEESPERNDSSLRSASQPELPRPSFDSPVRKTLASVLSDTIPSTASATTAPLTEAMLDSLMKEYVEDDCEESDIDEKEEQEPSSLRMRSKDVPSALESIDNCGEERDEMCYNETVEYKDTVLDGREENSALRTSQLSTPRSPVPTRVITRRTSHLSPNKKTEGARKEGSGRKSSRGKQRLSRCSQRYDSTDLYKPRPVLPQNSKRARSTRTENGQSDSSGNNKILDCQRCLGIDNSFLANILGLVGENGKSAPSDSPPR